MISICQIPYTLNMITLGCLVVSCLCGLDLAYGYDVLLPQLLVLNLIILWWHMEKLLLSTPVKAATSS